MLCGVMGDAMVTQGGRRTSESFFYGVCSNFRSTEIREITTSSYDSGCPKNWHEFS